MIMAVVVAMMLVMEKGASVRGAGDDRGTNDGEDDGLNSHGSLLRRVA